MFKLVRWLQRFRSVFVMVTLLYLLHYLLFCLATIHPQSRTEELEIDWRNLHYDSQCEVIHDNLGIRNEFYDIVSAENATVPFDRFFYMVPDKSIFLITKDNGKTWHQIFQLFSLNYHSCYQMVLGQLDRHIWFALDDRLFSSPDNGATWEFWYLENITIENHSLYYITDVTFTDAQNGTMVIDSWTDHDPPPQRQLTTTDGGRTWEMMNP